MIPDVLRSLKSAGHNVSWYLIGDGPLRPSLEKKIEAANVSDMVFLLGAKSDPYPYIRTCDIYVQTSFTEGYCTTTNEAKILCRPIVTTDVPGMREPFIDGSNGLIVDATPNALFEGIQKLLDDSDLCSQFTSALAHENVDNGTELNKLYREIKSNTEDGDV